MATKKFKQLTKAEEQIMQALWKIEKGTTHQIIEMLKGEKPHYNTVSTILKILNEKAFVSIEQVGKTNIYHPELSAEAYSKSSIKQMVKQYFNGSFTQLVSAFVKDDDISLEEMEAIMKQIKK